MESFLDRLVVFFQILFFFYVILQATLKRNLFRDFVVVVDFVTALNDHIDLFWNIQSLLVCIRTSMYSFVSVFPFFLYRQSVLFIQWCFAFKFTEDNKC